MSIAYITNDARETKYPSFGYLNKQDFTTHIILLQWLYQMIYSAEPSIRQVLLESVTKIAFSTIQLSKIEVTELLETKAG